MGWGREKERKKKGKKKKKRKKKRKEKGKEKRKGVYITGKVVSLISDIRELNHRPLSQRTRLHYCFYTWN